MDGENAAATVAALDIDDSEALRDDLVQRAADSLLADADRGEGELARSDINRAYLKRSLSIAECAAVERRLIDAGVNIIDDDDAEPENSSAEGGDIGFVPRGRGGYLTESEERDCGRRIQLAAKLRRENYVGDQSFVQRAVSDAERATARFVETNISYVWKVAREHHRAQHLTLDDLFQEGMLGLLKATEMYDPDMGFRFKTYATWWIRQRITRAIANDDRTVRLPVHLHEKIRRIQRAQKRLAHATGRSPDLRELATAIGAEPEAIAKLLWRQYATNCVEGDAPLESGEVTRLTLQADNDSASQFDIVADKELHRRFNSVLLSLSPREERVVRLRFGLHVGEDEQTLETIGQEFGVTRERIRQIEATALRKLRHPVRLKKLKEFLVWA